jgi:uncharacterized protein
VCAGGAPVNKLTENGSFDSERTAFCTLTQMVPIDLILAAFDQMQLSVDGQSLPQLLRASSGHSALALPSTAV